MNETSVAAIGGGTLPGKRSFEILVDVVHQQSRQATGFFSGNFGCCSAQAGVGRLMQREPFIARIPDDADGTCDCVAGVSGDEGGSAPWCQSGAIIVKTLDPFTLIQRQRSGLPNALQLLVFDEFLFGNS